MCRAAGAETARIGHKFIDIVTRLLTVAYACLIMWFRWEWIVVIASVTRDASGRVHWLRFLAEVDSASGGNCPSRLSLDERGSGHLLRHRDPHEREQRRRAVHENPVPDRDATRPHPPERHRRHRVAGGG